MFNFDNKIWKVLTFIPIINFLSTWIIVMICGLTLLGRVRYLKLWRLIIVYAFQLLLCRILSIPIALLRTLLLKTDLHSNLINFSALYIFMLILSFDFILTTAFVIKKIDRH